jgi:hypothetical protein
MTKVFSKFAAMYMYKLHDDYDCCLRGTPVCLFAGLSLTGCPTTPPSRQSVLCPVCGRLISQRRNLNQHMRTHQMAADDRIMDHAELAQVSVLPVNHVSARYASGSRGVRSAASHQAQPPQLPDEGSTAESDTNVSVNTLTHTPQPHYN